MTSSRRSAFTTAGIALLLAGVLVGDAAAVVELRADREQAEREELQRAETAFRDAVLPLAAEVQRVEAPLEAADELVLDSDGDLNVRYDVYANGTADTDLAALQQRLAAVPVPTTRRAAHDALTSALARMTETARTLASDTQAERSIRGSRSAFAAAGREWDRVATELGPTPPAAALDGPGPHTRAGVLYRWGVACAVGDQTAGDPPDSDQDPEAAAAALRRYAVTVEQVVEDILAVEPPSADAAAVEEVKAPLGDLGDIRQVLGALAEATRTPDQRALARVLIQLERLDVVLERATDAFDRYGSATCAGFFDPGSDEDGSPT